MEMGIVAHPNNDPSPGEAKDNNKNLPGGSSSALTTQRAQKVLCEQRDFTTAASSPSMAHQIP